MKAYRIISADSHAIEPPDLWQTYLPAAYADRGPRVVSGAVGDEWGYDGLPSRAVRRDGVDAEVLYPNYAMRLFAIPDLALQGCACAAYNDWLADFCRAHPAELLGIAVIPAFDVDPSSA